MFNNIRLTMAYRQEQEAQAQNSSAWAAINSSTDVDVTRVACIGAVFTSLIFLAPFGINQKSYKYASMAKLVRVSRSCRPLAFT